MVMVTVKYLLNGSCVMAIKINYLQMNRIHISTNIMYPLEEIDTDNITMFNFLLVLSVTVNDLNALRLAPIQRNVQ